MNVSLRTLLFPLILVILFNCVNSGRILAVFPTPCISHQKVFRPLTLELLRRGHELIVITTDPMYQKHETPENLTEIDLHDISYNAKEIILNEATTNKRSPLAQVFKMTELFTNLVELQFQSDEFQKILRNNETQYDLIIIEAWVRPMLVLSHVFKAPLIQLSSFAGLVYNYEALGVPVHPLRFPTFIHKKINNQSLLDKLKEVHLFLWFKFIIASSERGENAMLRRIFGANVPTISELSDNIDLLLLNVYPMWVGNIPVPPNVVYIGGIYKDAEQDLPEDLKLFLNASKHGVIYFSLGSNVKSSQLCTETIAMFLEVFSQLPYDVIWKWDKGQLLTPKNIMISEWLPQSSLLKHPKVKLFITHGGLQSTEEAISAGVPLIGIPFYGDQFYNVERYEQFKIGVKIDIYNITKQHLYETIMMVVKDRSYHQNMLRLRSLMNDQPQCPLERAVWWTEHVLRQRGAAHLRSPTANITWTEYLEIDLFIVIAILILTFSASCIWLLNCLLRYLISSLFNVKFKTD
ncbi:Ecdysteroid UDP-glucosyltransferase [Papilio xuthus]|uniref:UDP-glucuronosyltransferase n=1 Tax=Papilio xuthus TaxID=66420 RepID=A0A0N0P9D1_PAPXU|nr:Ecdysteroid UDP-glucosyltransferase [Papilio xuthus]